MKRALSYADLRSALREAPVTWIPALLEALITSAIEKEVFVRDTGLAHFVAQVQAHVGRVAAINAIAQGKAE